MRTTVWCCAASEFQAGAALEAVGDILASLGLELHPEQDEGS